jgi:hypothetical protein
MSVIFCFMGFTTFVNAQEQLGFHTDNYSGINSVLLNPAGHANTPFNWDINLAEGAFFLENNYFNVTPFRTLDINKVSTDDFYYGPDIKDPNELPGEAIIVDFIDNGKTRFATIESHLMGPSFFVRINESSTIGLTTGMRFFASGTGITDNLSYYKYFAQPFFEGFEVKKFSMGLLAWSEIGVNYMHQVELDGGNLAIGVTAKYLMGHEGAFLNSDASFQLTKLPGDTLSGGAINFNYGYTTTNLNPDKAQFKKNGSGFGFDLGFVFTADEFDEGYTWKIGASLLDIGKIKFTQNAKNHFANTNEVRNLATAGFQMTESPGEAFESEIRYFSEQMLGDSTLSLKGDNFSMWLPGAISVQAEYAFTQNVFINATVVQGIPFGGAGIRRANLIAVTPRFEHRWFGVSAPLSIYNWQDARVGLNARLAFLTFGTSNLGSIFRQSTYTGTDFYFAVKLNPFELGLSGRSYKGRKTTKKRKSLRGVKCYEF